MRFGGLKRGWRRFARWTFPTKIGVITGVASLVGIVIAGSLWLFGQYVETQYSLDGFRSAIDEYQVRKVEWVAEWTDPPRGPTDANALARGLVILMEANTMSDPLRELERVPQDSPLYLYNLSVNLAVHYAQTANDCAVAGTAVERVADSMTERGDRGPEPLVVRYLDSSIRLDAAPFGNKSKLMYTKQSKAELCPKPAVFYEEGLRKLEEAFGPALRDQPIEAMPFTTVSSDMRLGSMSIKSVKGALLGALALALRRDGNYAEAGAARVESCHLLEGLSDAMKRAFRLVHGSAFLYVLDAQHANGNPAGRGLCDDMKELQKPFVQDTMTVHTPP
jgi:hypothetical protein